MEAEPALNMAPRPSLVKELKCKKLLQNERPPEFRPQPGSSGPLCGVFLGKSATFLSVVPAVHFP